MLSTSKLSQNLKPVAFEERGHHYELYEDVRQGFITADYINSHVQDGVRDKNIFLCGPSPMRETRNHYLVRYFVTGLSMVLCLLATSEHTLAVTCSPTPWDEIGPYYRPNPPERNSIGSGYLLSGTVRSAGDCRPLHNVRIEIWQAGPDGTYDDAHRATLFSDRSGRYRLQTSTPPPYGRRPSHIHILVDAKGFEGLITQHYPKKGKKRATFDLVLEPEKQGEGKARDVLGR